MLDIKFIRENPEKVEQGAKNKGVEINVKEVLDLDEKRRALIAKSESIKAQQNKLGKDNIEEARELKEKFKALENELKQVEVKYKELMAKIPNIPFDEVPVGKDDSENKVLRKWGDIPKFDFRPREHWEIGEELDIIDIKRATKIAGSRFYYLKGAGALLEFALINFAIKELVKKGFTPIIPPVMIKPEMAWAMGYLQQGDKQEAYYLPDDDLYLTATSEQTLGAMRQGEVLEEKDLPLRYVGFSTCFRREAGSYGKDTKGILRVHQFDKIEMFVFCKPEDSAKEHQALLQNEEDLMQKLKLPYQVIDICTGDLGAPAAKKWDIEAWMPGQDKYRETHSTSNCTEFQSRRLNVKYRDSKTGKLEYVHTLNGTAFSMRPIIAILENFQQKDGSVKMPKVLWDYLGFKEIKAKK